MKQRFTFRIAKGNVFWKYLVGYFSVALVLILLLTTFSLWLSVRQYQQEWKTSNQLKLEQIKFSLDREFSAFYQIACQIVSNPHFLVKNIGNPYPSRDAVSDLKLYSSFAGLSSEILLIYDDPQVQHVYSSSGGMNTSYFDRYYSIDAFSLAYAQQCVYSMSSLVLVSTSQRIPLIYSDSSVRQYREILVYAIPLLSLSSNVPAIMLCIIDPARVFDAFDTPYENILHHPSLRTGDKIINASANRLTGKSTLSLEASSDLFPWSYCVELARLNIPWAWTFSLYAIMFVIAVGLALSASYMLAHHNYQPIQTMLHYLRPNGATLKADENEFAYINAILETISIKDNSFSPPENLAQLLTTYVPADAEQDVRTALKLPWTSGPLMLALFHSTDAELSDADIGAVLRECPDFPVVLLAQIGISKDILSLFAWEALPQREHILHDLERVQEHFAQRGLSLSIVASSFFAEINNIQRTFYQMQYAARYQFAASNLFLDMDLLSVVQRTCIDMNHHSSCHDLYQQLILGDTQAAQITFDQILRYMNDQQTTCNIGVFYLTLLSIFQQINEKVLGNEDLRHIFQEILSSNQGSLPELTACLTRCMRHILELLEAQKSTLRYESVLAVVESQYHSVDFSLQFLADQFSVSASTMSRFFKNECGIGLTEFVTNRRIADAKTLLSDTNLPIKTIAHNIGYNDVNHFIRRFKAYTGSTPTEFRSYGMQND